MIMDKCIYLGKTITRQVKVQTLHVCAVCFEGIRVLKAGVAG